MPGCPGSGLGSQAPPVTVCPGQGTVLPAVLLPSLGSPRAQRAPGSVQLAKPLPPTPQANLPLLQRELLHCARLAKQTPAQYLAQHEQLLLGTSTPSPVDSSEPLLEVNENGKRRTPDRYRGSGPGGGTGPSCLRPRLASSPHRRFHRGGRAAHLPC